MLLLVVIDQIDIEDFYFLGKDPLSTHRLKEILGLKLDPFHSNSTLPKSEFLRF